MQSQFTILIDACVLYSAPVRDLILQLAVEGLFRAKWSKRIQEEWKRNLLINRPDLSKEQLERTCEIINKSILDSVVEDYEKLAIGILPDADDDHVLAAALKSQAQIIVTNNLKDFPTHILEKYQIEVQHPDTFLRYQIDLHLPTFLSSVKAVRARLKNPPKTAPEYLFTLFNQIPQTVNTLKQFSDLI